MAVDPTQCMSVICKPDNYGAIRENIDRCEFNLFTSGIARPDTQAQNLAQGNAWSANHIFWADTLGYDEEGQIPGGVDDGCTNCETPCQKELMARRYQRNKCFTMEDATNLCNRAPESPEQMIIEGINRQQSAFRNGVIASSLVGIKASNIANDGGDMVFDATMGGTADPNVEGWFDYNVFIDGGGAGSCCDGEFGAMLMHCEVMKDLKKCEAIDFIQASQFLDNSNLTSRIPIYNGLRIVETNDSRLVDTSGANPVYTTVLFRNGFFRLGNGLHPKPLSEDRDECHDNGDGMTMWHMREIFTLHPEGHSNCWASANGKNSPTNAELANAATWRRVWDRKNTGVAFIDTYAGAVK